MDFDSMVAKQLLEHLFEGVYIVDQERRILFWNKAAQEISGYSQQDVLGKRCRDELLVHVDQKGQCVCDIACPLAESIQKKQFCQREVYFRHKQGHRVPVLVRVAPYFSKEGQLLGAIEYFQQDYGQSTILKRLAQLERMALLDPLTRLSNRRHIEANLQIRLEEWARYQWPFGVLFVDIDHFKSINDRHGHEIGDKIIKLVSMTLLNSLRPFDLLGRWGGDEFLGIVVNVSSQQLIHIAERARGLVAQTRSGGSKDLIPMTVSVGATLAQPHDDLKALVARADRLMYQSKQEGRNRVTWDVQN